MTKPASQCLICGAKTYKPFAATIEHLRPFECHEAKYFFGNIRQFGFWSGLRGNVCLYFPFLNTLLNWKYRKCHLDVEVER